VETLEDFVNQMDIVLHDLGDLQRVALSLALVMLAAIVSRWQRADLEKDLLTATARGFVQLVAIGYVLELVFNQDHPLWTTLVLVVMLTVAARTTAQRGRKLPHATLIAYASIGFGSLLTLAVLVLAGIFDYVPEAIIPIGGMIIGNAMTTASQVMSRMADDLIDQRPQIESMLALGATGRQSSLIQFRRGLRNAMIPHIDTTKTVGLIKLPGAMTGMILAGASPLEAVKIQIIVMYMLVGTTTFTGLIAAYLTYRAFFTEAHQLRALPETGRG
jgi:putative ABC transport system permease protein